MTFWHLSNPDQSPAIKAAFGSLDAVFALDGCKVTSDDLSEVILVQIGDDNFYVKRYRRAAKSWLRTWFGRPRIVGEWENLQHFAAWGLPIPPMLAWGMERRLGGFVRGALITAEVRDSQDLARIARDHDPRLQDRAWLKAIVQQIAQGVRLMHDQGFAHNDLRWRNLLIQEPDRCAGCPEQPPKVVFIDCPSGRFWPKAILKARILKDLASFDQDADQVLSATWRLRFYLAYRGHRVLDAQDKAFIRRLVLKNQQHRRKHPGSVKLRKKVTDPDAHPQG